MIERRLIQRNPNMRRFSVYRSNSVVESNFYRRSSSRDMMTARYQRSVSNINNNNDDDDDDDDEDENDGGSSSSNSRAGLAAGKSVGLRLNGNGPIKHSKIEVIFESPSSDTITNADGTTTAPRKSLIRKSDEQHQQQLLLANGAVGLGVELKRDKKSKKKLSFAIDEPGESTQTPTKTPPTTTTTTTTNKNTNPEIATATATAVDSSSSNSNDKGEQSPTLMSPPESPPQSPPMPTRHQLQDHCQSNGTIYQSVEEDDDDDDDDDDDGHADAGDEKCENKEGTYNDIRSNNRNDDDDDDEKTENANDTLVCYESGASSSLALNSDPLLRKSANVLKKFKAMTPPTVRRSGAGTGGAKKPREQKQHQSLRIHLFAPRQADNVTTTNSTTAAELYSFSSPSLSSSSSSPPAAAVSSNASSTRARNHHVHDHGGSSNSGGIGVVTNRSESVSNHVASVAFANESLRMKSLAAAAAARGSLGIGQRRRRSSDSSDMK